MNQLRDLWRMTWRHKEGPRDFGYRHEGVWVSPFETSANLALREAAVWSANGFMIPGGQENYPLVTEITLHTMDSGQPVEVVSLTITRKLYEGGKYEFPDGTPIEHTQKPQGTFLETEDGWSKVRKH